MNSLIRENTKIIGDFLSVRCNLEDPAGVLERLNECTSLLGTSSYNIAECEKEYAKKLGILAEEYKSQNATTAKNIIAGKMNEEIYYKTLCESQDKQLHYTVESLRTMISYLKNEINATRV